MDIRRAVAVSVLAGWLVPAVLWAQMIGTEFQVNTYTIDQQFLPSVATDASGNFVVVWGSGSCPGFTNPDGDCGGVFGQRFASTGSPLGTEFQVNTYTTSDQGRPTVASDPSGNFVVAWTSYTQDGASHSGVFGQRFASTGSPLGTEFQVNTYTAHFQRGPSVATDSSGNFVVVWGSLTEDGDFEGVFGQRFGSTGSPLGTEFQVSTYTTNNQVLPSVASDPSGNFVVVWTSNAQDGSIEGVFGQRFASTGSPLGTEFQVNTYTTDLQSIAGVATDSSGNFVVVWTSRTEDGDEDGVFGQRFASTGNPLGSEFQVNTYTASDQNDQITGHVATDPSGGFVVVWQSGRFDCSVTQDGDCLGVFGQRFASTGSALGTEFQVNTYTTDWQYSPSIASDSSGNFVVVWVSDTEDGYGSGIFGQRLGTPTGTSAATLTPTETPTGTPTGTSAATLTPTETPTATPTPGVPPTCPATPATCTTPAKSILKIKDKNEDGAGANDKLMWKWIKGPATAQGDFGDPTNTAGYTLCIYAGTAASVVADAQVAAGGTCGGTPCWKPVSTKGYKFKDKPAAQDGIAKILLKGSTGANSKIIFKGQDGNLDLTASTLPLSAAGPVSVRVHNSDNSNCWGADFATPFKKNTDGLFKGKTP